MTISNCLQPLCIRLPSRGHVPDHSRAQAAGRGHGVGQRHRQRLLCDAPEERRGGHLQSKVCVLTAKSMLKVILIGRVLLHLGSTLWVERVQLMVRQSSIATYVAKFDSAQDLVNEGG